MFANTVVLIVVFPQFFLPSAFGCRTKNCIGYEDLTNDFNAADAPTAQTSLGKLKGAWLKSAGGRDYAAFKGIPYARPPVGPLRFEPPQESVPWSGVRNAEKHGSQCLQKFWYLNIIVGDEDCLYLNVYTPLRRNGERNVSRTLLPVLFFIHGGSWAVGSGDMDNYLYGPDLFMDEDVVLVTINYRLGAFGFLSIEGAIPGNMGLKDQAMALRWIYKNAESFGGDRNKIVPMGQSAGGASVEYLILNKSSRKMISAGIAQSGSVLSPWAWTTPAMQSERTRKLTRAVSCTYKDPRAAVECLKRVDPLKIVKRQFSVNTALRQFVIGVSFTPTAEPKGTAGSFLEDCPLTLLTNPTWLNPDIPFLTGYTTNEGQLFFEISVAMVDLGTRSRIYREWRAGQREKALSTRRKRSIPHNFISTYTHLLGDYEFRTPITKGAQLHARAGSKVYLYHFAFVGKNNFIRLFQDSTESTHMDELTYMFQGRGFFSGLPKMVDFSPEKRVSQLLFRLWIDFARTRNPTPAPNEIQWPANPQKVLVIGDSLSRENATLTFKTFLPHHAMSMKWYRYEKAWAI